MIILIWTERNGLGICGLVDPAQRTEKDRIFVNMDMKFRVEKNVGNSELASRASLRYQRKTLLHGMR